MVMAYDPGKLVGYKVEPQSGELWDSLLLRAMSQIEKAGYGTCTSGRLKAEFALSRWRYWIGGKQLLPSKSGAVVIDFNEVFPELAQARGPK